MTLILTRSRDAQLRVGRFTLVIDEVAKVVYVTSKAGGAASAAERANLQKFLEYARPDIVQAGPVLTGWAIQFSVDIQLSGEKQPLTV